MFRRVEVQDDGIYVPGTVRPKLLGKHMGMFTEKAAVDVNVKVTRPDFTDPQARLQLARKILFMIASAEHAVKNAPKTIEHNRHDTPAAPGIVGRLDHLGEL